MKKIALAAALAATASTAFAGGMATPLPEASPVMIEPAPTGTAAAYIIPAVLAALIAAASSDSDSDTGT